MMLVQLTVEDLKTLITNAVRQEIAVLVGSEVKSTDEPLIIKGIKGLSQFLNISHSKAQAYKNSGLIPHQQHDRLIYFKTADVVEFATVNKRTERRRK